MSPLAKRWSRRRTIHTKLPPRVRDAAVIAITFALAGCGPVQRMARGYADAPALQLADALSEPGLAGAPRSLVGQRRLVLDDFGSLDTDVLDTYGTPWKLVAAALVQRRADRDGSALSEGTLRTVLREFGFLIPERVANWEGPSHARFRNPVGLLTGTASRSFPSVELEIAGLGCASCHSGMTYDANGMPTGEAWVGMPNTSLDLSAYGDSLFTAMRAALDDADRLLATVRTVYPDVSERELSTLRKYGIPRGRERLADLSARYGRGLPFANGGPGITNGVAALRHQLGMAQTTSSGHAFVSIPFLGDRDLKSSLLADGVYSAVGETRFAARSRGKIGGVGESQLDAAAATLAFFTIPTQGVTAKTARRAVEPMKDVMRYLAALRAPAFPGEVDRELAAAGERIYRESCASCHGDLTGGIDGVRLIRFPNELVPLATIGTDPERAIAADEESLARIARTGFDRWIDAENTAGYVAPPLTGVWATAPYLHNGSVPTLWQLMNPQYRPERFLVGGHALDYDAVGIALGRIDATGLYGYAAGYHPWSTPAVYDTREAGKGNRGHEREFDGLTVEQKRELLEYLKLL
jgi:mono/diheme cytochrome c family protein